MEVLKRNCGDNISDNLFDCVDCSFNLSKTFIRKGGVDNIIFHQITFGIVIIHSHKDNIYYHATSGIYLHNPLKIFNKLISHMGWHMLDSQKLYTT